MDLKEVFDFIEAEHKRLIEHYGFSRDSKLKYTFFAKLVEEIGELSEKILTLDSLQRADKLNNEKGKIEHEIADVLLTTLILARELGIDTEKALKEKIEKIKQRTY